MKIVTAAKLSALVLFGVAVLSPYSEVDAATTTTHGASCAYDAASAGAAGNGAIGYSENGAYNNALHPALVTVQCGGTSEVRNVSSVTVRVSDRNANDVVKCTATLFSLGHVFRARQTGQTTVSQVDATTSPITIPISAVNVTEITVRCDIPGRTTANGISFVSSYEVN